MNGLVAVGGLWCYNMSMRTEKEIENLLVVYAVEGYAHKHNMTPLETLRVFKKYGVYADIRRCYRTLHTQSLDESVYFAEDNLAAKTKNDTISRD